MANKKVEVVKGTNSDYAVEFLKTDTEGFAHYQLRRLGDGTVVANMNAYETRISIPIKGTRLIKNGKLRKFWRWSYTAAGLPACSRPVTRNTVETLRECVRDAIYLIDRDYE